MTEAQKEIQERLDEELRAAGEDLEALRDLESFLENLGKNFSAAALARSATGKMVNTALREISMRIIALELQKEN